MKKIFLSFIIAIVLLTSLPHPLWGAEKQVSIYYSQFCTGCKEYLDELIPMLKNQHIQIVKKDYIQDKTAQIELSQKIKKLAIRQDLIGHMMTFYGENIVFSGHVPLEVIKKTIQNPQIQKFKRLVIFQDEMHGSPKNYKVWAGGEVKTYPINEPASTFLEELKNPEEKATTTWLLPLVVSTALLDSLNPCAFAVLLFFIAFLYTIGRTQGAIFAMGFSYIAAIFLAYFLIGLGLLGSIIFFGQTHFMAKFGAVLIIALGIINFQSWLFPKSPIKLAIPELSKETIKNLMARSTIPASFILGFLVGLCTFPCSGGPYVAILTLLSAKTTYLQGFSYLFLYNLFFILPLFVILLFASNKTVTEKIANWEQSQAGRAKVISSLVMIALGIAILVFFV